MAVGKFSKGLSIDRFKDMFGNRPRRGRRENSL